ncbi:MAG: cardiolipin synthase [Bdellovibrionales bacterium]|nr:cardiolipin synthase [Bdellovibrionales bacterium]
MENSFLLTVMGVAAACIHFLGFLHAGFAIMKTRTSQGSTAWAISLITFPYVALPLFWIFGRNKFQGYVRARRSDDRKLGHLARDLEAYCAKHHYTFENERSATHALETLVKVPFLSGNAVQLYIDGVSTFDSIVKAIEAAEDYILIQFFIVRNDEIGTRIQELLIDKAQQGVRVYFLYDDVGCRDLPHKYIRAMSEKGVHVASFGGFSRPRSRFQINFRNHRKLVLIDGRLAFVGGHNIGDEYMGYTKKYGQWRDTHCSLEGPATMGLQLAFVEDWYWATKDVPALSWSPKPAAQNTPVLVLPTGPADDLDSCEVYFVHLINSAKKRIWIATPYFVPSGAVIMALQLAALRGVEVRILIPDIPDGIVVNMAAYTYMRQVSIYGITVYRYLPGFMHQKVILMDDEAASIGTANCDNRSFRLNFEVSALIIGRDFCSEVERMLERDFKNARQFHLAELDAKSLGFRLVARVARLFAPIL